MHFIQKTIIIFGVTLCLAACGTTHTASNQKAAAKGKQSLSKLETERLTKYQALNGGVSIDELDTPATTEASFALDPNTSAYEGYRVIQMLGLNRELSLQQQFIAIKAMFSNIPKDSPANGSGIRNIVFGSWYTDKSPLIFQVVKLKTGDYPAIALLFNTVDHIRSLNSSLVRAVGPLYKYPRTIKKDGRMSIEAGDYYALTILPNGQVSASRAVGKTLPAFETLSDLEDQINLTDDYLRDGNRENDAEVLPVLEKAIADLKVEPISRIHAYLQLFMFHLFSGEYGKAQQDIDQVNASPAMADSKAANTEIGQVARNDLKGILAIAQALSTGNQDPLSKL